MYASPLPPPPKNLEYILFPMAFIFMIFSTLDKLGIYDILTAVAWNKLFFKDASIVYNVHVSMKV